MSNTRFDELLPFYVNGTLPAEDRAWFESQLADDAAARAELEACRAMQAQVAQSLPQVPATIGLDRVMQRIRADQPSWQQRLASLFERGFGGVFDRLGVRPAPAFAGLAIIAVQAGVIVALMQPAADDAPGGWRAPKARVVTDAPMLKVNFAPQAQEAEIRHLLMAVQGQLAGGPGQLGDWFINVPAGRETAALAKLQQSPIVQAVALVPGLPPRE